MCRCKIEIGELELPVKITLRNKPLNVPSTQEFDPYLREDMLIYFSSNTLEPTANNCDLVVNVYQIQKMNLSSKPYVFFGRKRAE